MKEFLKELEKEAKKYLDEKETLEVINYYEEIINDRLTNNEEIEDVLVSYNAKAIIKELLPEVITKRNLKKPKNAGKSVWQLILVLFSAPILIPLAITFIVLVVAIIIVLCAVAFSLVLSILAIIPYIIEIFGYASNFGSFIGLLGLGIIGVTILAFLGSILLKFTFLLLAKIIKLFSGFVLKWRVWNEKNRTC